MRIFAAMLATETNTFAVVPTGRADFEVYGVYRGDASRKAGDGFCGAQLGQLQRLAAADGHEVIESLAAFAQPAGPTLRQVYEDFRGQILEDLRAAPPVDAVQLYLHGAMVAEGHAQKAFWARLPSRPQVHAERGFNMVPTVIPVVAEFSVQPLPHL